MIAQIIYSGLGGHGSVAFSLIEAAVSDESEYVIGFLGIEPTSESYIEKCNKLKIDFEYFPAVEGRPWHIWPKLYLWLKKTGPKCIILHSVTALLPCYTFCLFFGAQLIIVEHQANALKRRIEWVFTYLGMLLADHVVVLTPNYQTELKRKLGRFYRAAKVRVIANGIDLVKFRPKNGEPKFNRSIRIGMAARFVKGKRQELLVETLYELVRLAPSVNWELSLAGSGKNFDNIKILRDSLALTTSCHMEGELNEQQLVDWFHTIDIYALATDGETLNTSLLQAMACGVPIVASDVVGVRSLLDTDTRCGILVPANNSIEFSKSIHSLAKAGDLAAELVRAARTKVEAAYSNKVMLSEYAKLIK